MKISKQLSNPSKLYLIISIVALFVFIFLGIEFITFMMQPKKIHEGFSVNDLQAQVNDLKTKLLDFTSIISNITSIFKQLPDQPIDIQLQSESLLFAMIKNLKNRIKDATSLATTSISAADSEILELNKDVNKEPENLTTIVSMLNILKISYQNLIDLDKIVKVLEIKISETFNRIKLINIVSSTQTPSASSILLQGTDSTPSSEISSST